MFSTSIDLKSVVTDPNGNSIKNLPVSPIMKGGRINSYKLKRVPNCYRMRPDLISLVEYGSTEKTEYIMMFNQIGNPFALDEDDVLLIPDVAEADAIMIPYDSTREDGTDSRIQDLLVQNYYKYVGNHNFVDLKSYDDYLNNKIPSGNVDNETEPTTTTVPYLLNNEEESMVIKNGKIYFNNPNDVGIQDNDMDDLDIDTRIQNILDGVTTDLSKTNCTYNGTMLSDFIKALNQDQE